MSKKYIYVRRERVPAVSRWNLWRRYQRRRQPYSLSWFPNLAELMTPPVLEGWRLTFDHVLGVYEQAWFVFAAEKLPETREVSP